MLNRSANIKDTLIHTGDGYYISSDDTQLYKKIEFLNISDGHTLYKVGLALEKQAKYNFKKFKETRRKDYFNVYKERINESMELMKKSWKSGYVYAGKDILRIYSSYSKALKTKLFPTKVFYLVSTIFCFLMGMMIYAVYYILA